MINCKEIANNIKEELKNEIHNIKKETDPCLAIIQVGNNAASNNYVKGKIKDCEEIGIIPELYKLKETVTENDVINLIKKLNYDVFISGIIVQLPLPSHLNEVVITNSIIAKKDVDGFRNDSPFTPCTPLGVLTLLDKLNIEVSGKLVTLVGYGNLVNKPLMNLLSNKGATVCVCRSKTIPMHLEHLCNISDIVITATGKHGIIDGGCVEPDSNALIIDCGIEVIEGKQFGDCSEEVYELTDNVTPRINGMGLMTRVGLLHNVVEAYKWN